MAKKEENTEKAPRLSTIERLQRQLAEAEAKQKERNAKKVDAIKEQYRAAVKRRELTEIKIAGLVQQITNAIGYDEMVEITEAIDAEVNTEIDYDGMVKNTETTSDTESE